MLSWQSRDTAKVKNPDNIWLEIIPEIKSWIKNIAINAQDSDCEAGTIVSTPSVTTTTTTITTITTTSKYQLVKLREAKFNNPTLSIPREIFSFYFVFVPFYSFLYYNYSRFLKKQ